MIRDIVHSGLALVLAGVALLLTQGCSTTKRIPDGEILYTGLKGLDVESDSVPFPRGVTEALNEAVDVSATKKMWYVLPVGLWVYNNWNVTDSTKGLKRRLYDKLVKDPVLVSDVRPRLRVKMLDEILDNNGYFQGRASYELVQPKDNKKKAKIQYNVIPGPAYMIDSVKLMPDTTHLIHLIDSLVQADNYLRSPGRFSMDSLSMARTRISNGVRRRGYYFFRPEYIEYLADSFYTQQRVSVHLDLAANTPKFALQRYRTGKVTMDVYRHQGGGEPDTTVMKNMTLVQMMPSRLRHSAVANNVTFRPGRWFSTRDMDNTQAYLSRLGIFQGLNIEAVPDTTAAVPTLDVNIGATFDMPLEASIEANVASK